jgi:hypothetical protein
MSCSISRRSMLGGIAGAIAAPAWAGSLNLAQRMLEKDQVNEVDPDRRD